MRKNVKEDSNLTASPISVRIKPETIDLLKRVTNEKQTATAIIKAVEKVINDYFGIFEISEISAVGDKFVSTLVAAKLLKYSDGHIRYLARERKIVAVKGNNSQQSRWLISLEDIKLRLIPNVNKTV